MDMNRVMKKITASYATGIRGDLDIADFQKLDAVTAHLLLEYAPNIGKPSADDVERYIQKMFEGRVKPVMASLAVKPNCVSIIAQLDMPTRPMADADDKSKMTPVMAGMMYLDNQLGDIWNVTDSTDGQKVLAKQGKENIEQIIAARRNRMFVTKSSSVSLASVAAAKDLLPAGCTVKAWHQGKLQSLEVMAKVQGGFQVKNADGKEFVVAKEGIIDLIEMAKDAPNEAAKLSKYYGEAYGDKGYGAALVKK